MWKITQKYGDGEQYKMFSFFDNETFQTNKPAEKKRHTHTDKDLKRWGEFKKKRAHLQHPTKMDDEKNRNWLLIKVNLND